MLHIYTIYESIRGNVKSIESKLWDVKYLYKYMQGNSRWHIKVPRERSNKLQFDVLFFDCKLKYYLPNYQWHYYQYCSSRSDRNSILLHRRHRHTPLLCQNMLSRSILHYHALPTSFMQQCYAYICYAPFVSSNYFCGLWFCAIHRVSPRKIVTGT